MPLPAALGLSSPFFCHLDPWTRVPLGHLEPLVESFSSAQRRVRLSTSRDLGTSVIPDEGKKHE